MARSGPTAPAAARRWRIGGRAAHTASGALLAWVYATFLLVAAPLALVLSLVGVGIPLVLGLLALGRAVAGGERRLSNRLLGTAIAAPARLARSGGTRRQRLALLTRQPSTWRSVGYLVVRTALGVVASIVLVVGLGLAFDALVGGAGEVLDGRHVTGTWSTAWGVPVGAAVLLALLGFAVAWGWVGGVVASAFLGPPPEETIRALHARAEELSLQTRLVQDLHDSVGHTMTVVAVQANAATALFDDDPDFVRDALAAIGDSVRRALDELDHVLGVLRDEPTALVDPPTLAELDPLVDRCRAAGLPVEVVRRGGEDGVDGDVAAAVYRIVQEGCTNVIRHAGLARTEVAVDVGARHVTVEVANAAPTRPAPSPAPSPSPGAGLPGPGRGLIGVEERVRALGGECRSGPGPHGGFVLWARLPRAGRA